MDNPVKGIHIVLPEREEEIYTKITRVETATVPAPEITPKQCRDKSTLLIHMCRKAQEGGYQLCEDCESPCEWGREYLRRMKRSTAWHRPKEKLPKPEASRRPRGLPRGTCTIPFFGPWIAVVLRNRGLNQHWLAAAIGYSYDTVYHACSLADRWSRDFETKTMDALGMSEETAVRLAAEWAWHEMGVSV